MVSLTHRWEARALHPLRLVHVALVDGRLKRIANGIRAVLHPQASAGDSLGTRRGRWVRLADRAWVHEVRGEHVHIDAGDGVAVVHCLLGEAVVLVSDHRRRDLRRRTDNVPMRTRAVNVPPFGYRQYHLCCRRSKPD